MEEKRKRLLDEARKDPEFVKMEKSCSKLEKLFEQTLHLLPPRQQDILWGFVLKSTELDQYLLDLALKVPWNTKEKE